MANRYPSIRITKAAFEHLKKLVTAEQKKRGTHVATVNLVSELILSTRVENGNGHHEKKTATTPTQS